MFLGLLVLITALTISAVAIYYSVAGLVAIFAAAALPIVIMGGALEIGKLVTAVWLHRYWRETTWWLKTYLTAAVVVLMFITSMGIFGFLSKAHIEQTAASEENVAQVERIDQEIARQQALIARAEQRIEGLETGGSGAQANIQAQIDREQERINNAYARIQPAIDEQNRIIEGKTSLFQDQIDQIDQELARLQNFVDNGDIERAQAMVGTAVDGDYGPNTARAFQEFQTRKAQEREQLVNQIVALNQDPTILSAREEIQRIRRSADEQIAQSNELINSLRQRLSNNDSTNVETLVAEQNELIRTASSELDRLTEEKFAIEAEYRKLEAEVGPIKYIADFVYGEADTSTLEDAVRWVILIIIFVFDPLAVLLLIASQYTFENRRKQKQEKESLRPVEPKQKDTDDLEAEIESVVQMHSARIKKEKENDIPVEEADTDADATVRSVGTESIVSDDVETGHRVEQDEVQSDGLARDDIARSYSEVDQSTDEEIVEALDRVYDEELVEPVDEEQLNRIQELVKDVELEDPVEKKELESSEELKQTRTEELAAQEDDVTWSEAKRTWKEEHPDLTLKEFKEKYINGEIDHLPWEEYITDESKKKSYMIKEGTTQIRKTTEE